MLIFSFSEFSLIPVVRQLVQISKFQNVLEKVLGLRSQISRSLYKLYKLCLDKREHNLHSTYLQSGHQKCHIFLLLNAVF